MTKNETVTISPMDLKVIKVEIEGIRPLIMDKKPDHVLENILAKQTGKTKITKEARDVEKEVKEAMHLTDDNEVGFPSYGFKKGMVECATFLGDKMFSKKLINGNVFIVNGQPPNDLIPIKFKKQGVIKHAIGTNLKFSPCFFDWSCVLEIQFDNNNISQQDIITTLEHAGFKVGIGAWRPKGGGGGTGTYGMYRIKRHKEEKAKGGKK